MNDHSTRIDVADRLVFRLARERDRLLWLTNAARKWRHDLRAKRDAEQSAAEYFRRANAIELARDGDTFEP